MIQKSREVAMLDGSDYEDDNDQEDATEHGNDQDTLHRCGESCKEAAGQNWIPSEKRSRRIWKGRYEWEES